MNPYEVLGVPKDAIKAEIKKAYRSKVQQAHPDKGGSAEDTQRLNDAYAILSDDEARARYDETGQTSSAGADRQTAELTALMRAVIDRVSSVENVDIVLEMRTALKSTIQGCQQQKHQVDAAMQKRAKALKRLTIKEGATNLLAEALNADILHCRQTLGTLEDRIKELWLLIDRVDDYQYKADPSAPTYTAFPFTTTTFR
jgi:curved DNA-binding protein CbpA